MSQEELELKEQLEVNQLEMFTQEEIDSTILEKLYEQGLYKEYSKYVHIIRIREIMKYIN